MQPPNLNHRNNQLYEHHKLKVILTLDKKLLVSHFSMIHKVQCLPVFAVVLAINVTINGKQLNCTTYGTQDKAAAYTGLTPSWTYLMVRIKCCDSFVLAKPNFTSLQSCKTQVHTYASQPHTYHMWQNWQGILLLKFILRIKLVYVTAGICQFTTVITNLKFSKIFSLQCFATHSVL